MREMWPAVGGCLGRGNAWFSMACLNAVEAPPPVLQPVQDSWFWWINSNFGRMPIDANNNDISERSPTKVKVVAIIIFCLNWWWIYKINQVLYCKCVASKQIHFGLHADLLWEKKCGCLFVIENFCWQSFCVVQLMDLMEHSFRKFLKVLAWIYSSDASKRVWHQMRFKASTSLICLAAAMRSLRGIHLT